MVLFGQLIPVDKVKWTKGLVGTDQTDGHGEMDWDRLDRLTWSDGLEILSARGSQVGMVTWTKVETNGPQAMLQLSYNLRMSIGLSSDTFPR